MQIIKHTQKDYIISVCVLKCLFSCYSFEKPIYVKFIAFPRHPLSFVVRLYYNFWWMKNNFKISFPISTYAKIRKTAVSGIVGESSWCHISFNLIQSDIHFKQRHITVKSHQQITSCIVYTYLKFEIPDHKHISYNTHITFSKII